MAVQTVLNSLSCHPLLIHDGQHFPDLEGIHHPSGVWTLSRQRMSNDFVMTVEGYLKLTNLMALNCIMIILVSETSASSEDFFKEIVNTVYGERHHYNFMWLTWMENDEKYLILEKRMLFPQL